MITIRAPQTKDDFRAYYALRYRVLREPGGQPHGTEKDDYEPISNHLMAVEEPGGQVCGVVKWLEREPGLAWLTHLAVDYDHQKQGIGRLLVQTVEDAARAQGYKTIATYTRIDSRGFFVNLGYRIIDLPAYHFGPVPSVWLEKDL